MPAVIESLEAHPEKRKTLARVRFLQYDDVPEVILSARESLPRTVFDDGSAFPDSKRGLGRGETFRR